MHAACAFLLGQLACSLDSARKDNWPSVLFAMAGGVVLGLGNLSAQYGWPFVGLSVSGVLAASVTVVIGTTLSYFLYDKINRAEILFPGVGCFLIAVCLASAVHTSNAADDKAKLGTLANSDTDETGVGQIPAWKESDENLIEKDLVNGIGSAEKAKVGSAYFLIELEKRRAIKVFGKSSFIGSGITFFCGLCFSIFSPEFNLATNDQWDTLKDGVPHLSVYTTFFWFSVSCFVISIILNIGFLYHPVLNLPRSSYLSDWNGRGWALLAGFFCCFGNGLQFMGGETAGYAAADAVQALLSAPNNVLHIKWSLALPHFGEFFCLESTEEHQEKHIYCSQACCLCSLLLLEFSWHLRGIRNDSADFHVKEL